MTEFEILQNNAEKGDAESQYNLGLMYANGRGVEQSDIKAVAWWQKSAEQGNSDAQNHLGVMYYGGEGVEQSDAKAFEQKELAKKGFGLSEQELFTRLSKLTNAQGKQIANTLNEAEQVLEALNKIKP